MGRSLTKEKEVFDTSVINMGSTLRVTWTTGAKTRYSALVLDATPLWLLVVRVSNSEARVQEERLEIGDFVAGKFTLAELTDN